MRGTIGSPSPTATRSAKGASGSGFSIIAAPPRITSGSRGPRSFARSGIPEASVDALDDVSAGEADYREVLSGFWRDFSAALAETADLRISEVLEKIDEVLEPHPGPAVTQPGDVWILGRHRLICGDAREPATYANLNKYVLVTLAIGLSGWVVANLVGNYIIAG